MKRLFIACALFFGVVLISSAQKIIKGTVISAKNGKPVAGAIISAKSAKRNTIVVSDINGKFRISVAPTTTIIEVAAYGYNDRSEKIGKVKVITIVLDPLDQEKPESVLKNKPKNPATLKIDSAKSKR